ncbi:hypothetical protein HDU96_010837 [Phlyctochytrium bullatum]|nr:hypothetical protein HDU96_010837 [Phlyctochytrium bullatum]
MATAVRSAAKPLPINAVDRIVACRNARVHVIHYLIGNPLPFAPLPDTRPLRPGDLSGPSLPFHPSSVPRFKNILHGDENPLATLFDTYTDTITQSPLELLLTEFRAGDAVHAATYLLDQGAAPVGLHAALLPGNVGVLRVLVERGAAVDGLARNPGRLERFKKCTCTPLFVAGHAGEAECARVLLELGADQEAGVLGGLSPLGAALEEGNVEVAKVLVRK